MRQATTYEQARAARLLGRPYMMDGQVAHGDKIGRQLGFATANIRVRHIEKAKRLVEHKKARTARQRRAPRASSATG